MFRYEETACVHDDDDDDPAATAGAKLLCTHDSTRRSASACFLTGSRKCAVATGTTVTPQWSSVPTVCPATAAGPAPTELVERK